MKITQQMQDVDSNQFMDWHKLVVAEAGFSMLDIYARHKHDIDIQVIQQFADQVNRRNEPGSLYPKAPISALPRRYFREIRESEIPNHIDQFRDDLRQFIQANRSNIRASKVLVDFHVSPQPVPTEYITAIEEVFRLDGAKAGIEEVVIFR
jgi:hypothetical protein